MKSVMILVAVVIIVSVGFSALSQQSSKTVRVSKPQIFVSNFVLMDLSRQLLQEIAEVTMLVPFGEEVQRFKPTPKSMEQLRQSTLVVISGIEPWVADIDADIYNVRLHVNGHQARDGVTDGYYWLDLRQLIHMTQQLAQEYGRLFGEHAKTIAQRAEAYVRMLQGLDALYVTRLKACKHDSIHVDDHRFGYLADRYGFKAQSSAPLHVTSKQHDITPLKLHSLTNITAEEAKEYYDVRLLLQLNLQTLYRALGCGR